MTYTLVNPTQERRMLALRLLSRAVETPSGCLEFTGSRTAGYGRLESYRNPPIRAHVLSYDLFVGPARMVKGFHVHHVCRNKACVNPAHLEGMTNAEHMRMHNNLNGYNPKAAVTHCRAGHELKPPNIYTPKAGVSRRVCKICHREAYRRWYAKPESKAKVKAYELSHKNKLEPSTPKAKGGAS